MKNYIALLYIFSDISNILLMLNDYYIDIQGVYIQ